jgi:uncharacterized protein with PIN domain
VENSHSERKPKTINGISLFLSNMATKKIKCPVCKHEGVYTQFREVMLIPTYAKVYAKPNEILTGRICPKCSVVFWDKESDKA